MPSSSIPLPRPFNRRDPLITEAAIQKHVITFLQLQGCFVQRVEGGGKAVQRRGEVAFARSCMAGFPDLLVIHRGRVWGLEIKAPGGALSAVQLAKLEAMQRAGCQVGIVLGTESLWSWMQGESLSIGEVAGIDLVC